MANHVDNIIEIQYDKNDENAQKFLQSIYDLGMNSYDNESSLSDVFENPENTITWWSDNIGAKWAYINDLDSPPEDGFFYMNITSAWSEVRPFVEHISRMLNDKCKITLQFIDEMPNFIGCLVMNNGDIEYDYYEEEIHDLIEQEKEIRMIAENKSFESDDEMYDWVWDWKWDYIHDMIEPGYHSDEEDDDELN